MTEIQKARQWSNPGGWQVLFVSFVSLGLMFGAMMQSTLPNHQWGATACVLLFAMLYPQVLNFPLRRLSKELVQEIDTLQRELDELKAR